MRKTIQKNRGDIKENNLGVGSKGFYPLSGSIFVRRDFLSDWMCFGADESRPEPLDPVEEKTAGEKAVQRLGAFLLAFYGETRRQMDEKDARGGLVDLLTPGTGGTDEGFAELLLPDAELLHPFTERRIFFWRNDHFCKGYGA